MKKIDAIVLKVFLYGLPAVVVLGIFAYPYTLETINRAAGHVRLLYNLSGLVFAVWIAFSIYLSLRLMISRAFRDRVLTRLTFMRERDEREAILTGKAARTTFLTSLAILIFLFCLSCFQVSVYRLPPEKAVDGKTRAVTLGFGFNLLENPKGITRDQTIEKKDIFSYTGLPVSSATVILALMLWQIVSYNVSMRRLTK